MATSPTTTHIDHDAIVIGAGFAGLYALHKLRDQLGLSVRVFEAGVRRRRHLVLEPLPGRALRHREHGLLILVLRGAAAGVGVERALRRPARDPALPEPRRRPVRPAQATSRSTPGSTSMVWDDDASLWRVGTEHGDDRHRPVRDLRGGQPVGAEDARVRRRRVVRAARCTSPETGRTRTSTSPAKRVGIIGDRVQRHPGDLRDREAGGPPDGLPAHAELRHPDRQRARGSRRDQRA